MCSIVLFIVSMAILFGIVILDWVVTKEFFSGKLKNVGQILLGVAAIVGVVQIPRVMISQSVENNFYQTINNLNKRIEILEKENKILREELSLENDGDNGNESAEIE